MKSLSVKTYVRIKVLMFFLGTLFRYLGEAALRVFSPDDDMYPAVGVQPYDGDYHSKWG